MIVLYTAVLLVLGTAGFVIRRRAASLERKYAGVVKETHALLKEPHKEGNSSRSDPYQAAKRQYQLGQMVARKERLEAKHYFWEGLSERATRWVQRVRDWKGRKVPYTLGALDVITALTLLEHYGLGEYTSPRALLNIVTTWLNV
jgi:hypothetical protein